MKQVEDKPMQMPLTEEAKRERLRSWLLTTAEGKKWIRGVVRPILRDVKENA